MGTNGGGTQCFILCSSLTGQVTCVQSTSSENIWGDGSWWVSDMNETDVLQAGARNWGDLLQRACTVCEMCSVV